MIKEITFEITNYCPEKCKYCSSDSTDCIDNAIFLSFDYIYEFLQHKQFERINISGGEPLSHPEFYKILKLCEKHSKAVAVYTNALMWVFYNANVIDGICVEANLTVPDNTEKIHILKRIEQGREAKRSEITFSKNWAHTDCVNCKHNIVRPTGDLTETPCNKYKKVDNKGD